MAQGSTNLREMKSAEDVESYLMKMGVAHEQNEAEQLETWKATTAEYDGQVKLPPGVAQGTFTKAQNT